MMAKEMRLDKLLGHGGWGTRRQIKELCKKGHVFVNDVCCKDSSMKVNPQSDAICVDGQSVVYEEFYYIMMHKPAGVISATEDRAAKTVLDLLDGSYQGAGLFPVGRLDKDTTGLLLLTNDGTWAHRIITPKKHIDKVYEAVVDGEIPMQLGDTFEKGIVLADGLQCMPAKAKQVGDATLEITVQEGKYHQVKRMCAAVGLSVVQLHRRSIGGLVLDAALAPGEYRKLTVAEQNLPFSDK